MEEFNKTYGFYPKYPVANAGYGSYNNYIYCEQHGMEKYMKFPMFKKETEDKKYKNNPFRAVNFRIDENGVLRCPNDKAFHLQYRKFLSVIISINTVINERDCEKLHELNKNALYGGKGELYAIIETF